jgi:hypothetical protein
VNGAGGFIVTRGDLDHAIGRPLFFTLLRRVRCSGYRFARLLLLGGVPFVAVAFTALEMARYGDLPVPWIMWSGFELAAAALVVSKARGAVGEDEGAITIDRLILDRVVSARLSRLLYLPIAVLASGFSGGDAIIGYWIVSVMAVEMVALYAVTTTGGAKRKPKEPWHVRAKMKLQELAPRMPQRIPIPIPVRV